MATHRTLLPAVVLTIAALLPACGGSSSGRIATNPPGPNGEPGIGDGAGPPPVPAAPADPADPAEPVIDEPADPEMPADPDGP